MHDTRFGKKSQI